MDPNTQANYENNGKVMLLSTIVFFLIVMVVVFFHTFRHSCVRSRRHHHHGILTDSSVAFSEGLHPSVLDFLPTFTYSSNPHHARYECSVCLSEFADGEQGRILPNCNHAFHSHCIDPWFRSHSNCPFCRTPVHPRAVPVQPPRTASSNIEPSPVGFSSFPAPIGCPRKSLELEGIIVELEGGRPRESDSDSGRRPVYHGLRFERVG
ncbi:hypothetical protein VNO77_13989 [Canavalia gladiata]|uniref:RING-type E3 ubiquitin transferase n=1 Tax=Canavalia gladiata TaxID=3824 RepID=A0AAN9QQK7_CANGL